MEIKFTKESALLINQIGNVTNFANGDTYIHVPYWFKKTDQEDVHEVLTFENLPDELLETLDDNRNKNNFYGYCSKETTEGKRCKNICDKPECGW